MKNFLSIMNDKWEAMNREEQALRERFARATPTPVV